MAKVVRIDESVWYHRSVQVIIACYAQGNTNPVADSDAGGCLIQSYNAIWSDGSRVCTDTAEGLEKTVRGYGGPPC